jgi:predicted nuclease of predicted toxin-antitoxin system
MKLLFDQNLSPLLVRSLVDLFPGSDHVFYLGLDTADDRSVRTFAAENNFIVVTKDADYSELHSLFGSPPKVIWIRRGNCSTRTIETILRSAVSDIQAMFDDGSKGVLVIY